MVGSRSVFRVVGVSYHWNPAGHQGFKKLLLFVLCAKSFKDHPSLRDGCVWIFSFCSPDSAPFRPFYGVRQFVRTMVLASPVKLEACVRWRGSLVRAFLVSRD